MRLNYILSPAAEQDINEISAYIAKENSQAAISMILSNPWWFNIALKFALTYHHLCLYNLLKILALRRYR